MTTGWRLPLVILDYTGHGLENLPWLRHGTLIT